MRDWLKVLEEPNKSIFNIYSKATRVNNFWQVFFWHGTMSLALINFLFNRLKWRNSKKIKKWKVKWLAILRVWDEMWTSCVCDSFRHPRVMILLQFILLSFHILCFNLEITNNKKNKRILGDLLNKWCSEGVLSTKKNIAGLHSNGKFKCLVILIDQTIF